MKLHRNIALGIIEGLQTILDHQEALRPTLQKLLKRNNFTTDLFLSYFNLQKYQDFIEIEVNENTLKQSTLNEATPQISVTPSIDRNNYLNITIVFKNPDGEKVYSPELLRLLSFDTES